MKLPFIKFFPADWLRDTSHLSARAKAIWIDILCYAWNEPERGVYARSHDHFKNQFHLSDSEFLPVIKELQTVAGVTLHNEKVTVISRRMVREEAARFNNANRQASYRQCHKSNTTVTVQTLDVRCQKSEKERNTKERKVGSSPPALGLAGGLAKGAGMTADELRSIRARNFGSW